MNGYGILVSKIKIMEGEFLMGKKNGFMIITYINGVIIQAQFKNNDYINDGIIVKIINKNKKIYSKIYKKKIVYSILEENYNDNNNNYLGEYMINEEKYLRQGFGQLKDKYGFYEGYFINGVKEGYGELYFNDGKIYKGNFKNNCMDGKGLLKFNNGDSFYGIFKNNKIFGFGTYLKKNENTTIWIENYQNEEK